MPVSRAARAIITMRMTGFRATLALNRPDLVAHALEQRFIELELVLLSVHPSQCRAREVDTCNRLVRNIHAFLNTIISPHA